MQNYHNLHQHPRALLFLLVYLFSIWIFVFNGWTLQWLLTEKPPASRFFCAQPRCLLHAACSRLHTAAEEKYWMCSALTIISLYHCISVNLVWSWSSYKIADGVLVPTDTHRTCMLLVAPLSDRLKSSFIWRALGAVVSRVQKQFHTWPKWPESCWAISSTALLAVHWRVMGSAVRGRERRHPHGAVQA